MTHPDHSPDPGGDATDRLLAEAGFVRRLARSLVRDAALADDVAQETLAAGLAQPGAPRSWRDWLATVTRRQASKARAARRVREAHEAAAARERASHGGREAHAVAGGVGAAAGGTAQRLELQQQLTAAVAALAEPYRTVVTLRYFDGLTPRAIAKRSGATAAAVRQQLHRGLAMLRLRLDRDCGGRQRWLGAFAAAGLGGVTVSLVPIALLAMNKLALAVAAVLVAGGVVWMVADPSHVAPPVVQAVEAGAPSVAAAELPMRERRDAELLRSDADAALPKCEVVVLDSAGAPIEGAEVLICDTRGESEAATTDADGVAAKAASGPGMVLARCAGYAPAWRSLDECTGRHVLALGDGEVVGGVLLVDGAPAKEGTRLRVSPGSSLRHAGAPESFEKWFNYRGTKDVIVGHNGRFRLQGLPTDLNGILWLPGDLWLVAEPGMQVQSHDRLPLIARDDLTVRTTQLEVFEANVVWSDNGQPVDDVDLRMRALFDNGDSTSGIGPVPKSVGYFRVGLSPGLEASPSVWDDPITRPKVARLRTTVSAPGSTATRTIEFEREDLVRGPITIRLDRATRSHFVAFDEFNKPIAGARVLTHHLSAPTDASGHGTFDGTRSEVKLIGAAEHMIAPPSRSRGHGTAADPFVFVLPRDNPIIVHMLGVQGGAPAAQFVAIYSDDLPFAGRREVTELDRALHPCDDAGRGTSPRGMLHQWQLPSNGDPFTLHSIEPGSTLTVALLDCMRTEIASARVIAPTPGVTLEVTLKESTPPFHVSGVLVDQNGDAIPRADVQVSAIDPDAIPQILLNHTHSDASGAFRLEGLHKRLPLKLRIRADGYCLLEHDVPVDQLERPLRLQMAKGNVVAITVRDPDGIAVDVPVTAHRLQVRGEQVTPGTTRFVGLPDGKIEFRAQLGKRAFSIEHDSAQPYATLEVPKPATLRINAANGWPRREEQHQQLIARVQCLDRTDEVVDVEQPDRPGAKPLLLLPGPYRVELREGHYLQSRPLGLTADVTLTAGETTTATLR